MIKKLLFVIPSLEAGGGEKSLVTLLNTIDLQKYDVDLLLLKKEGLFLKLVPQEITILSIDDNYALFTKPLFSAILHLCIQGSFRLALSRLLFTITIKSSNNKGIAEQKSWKHIKKAIPKLTTKYDVAIGFLEKSSIYFVVDCVIAKNKIGFIHNDYNQLNLDAKLDLPYFKKLQTIATVSEQCKVVLEDNFPSEKDKIKVIRNIVSSRLIKKMAEDKIDMPTTKPILLSIGRLHPQKGFDIAIETAKILRNKTVDFCWYVIGEGAERVALENKIATYHLQNHFVLLGLKENPYPYLKAATVVIQSSRYEGKSIAIDEAKILQKPIIVTNFTTAKDQIEHLKTGIISEMNPESLASEIENLLQDESLQQELSLHLLEEQLAFETDNEIEAFYQIVHNEY